MPSLEDIPARVVRVEEHTEALREDLRTIHTDLQKLNKDVASLETSIALLNYSITTLNKNNESKRGMLEKINMFIVGGFLAAAISWIVRGGLSQ